jgi:alkylhydroperoxidase family enzyme
MAWQMVKERLPMPFMPSMPADALVRDVYSINPQTFRHWLHVEEAIMRGPSAFTAGERELIAAYVSRLNSCTYGMRPYCLSIVRMEPTSVTQCRRERDQICVVGTS